MGPKLYRQCCCQGNPGPQAFHVPYIPPLWKLVPARGIEPRSEDYKAPVIPLYYAGVIQQEIIFVTVYETVVLPLDYFASRQKLDSNQQYNIVAFAASFLKLATLKGIEPSSTLLDRQVSSPDDSKAIIWCG